MGSRVWAALSIVAMAMLLWSMPARAIAAAADYSSDSLMIKTSSVFAPQAGNGNGNGGSGNNGNGNGGSGNNGNGNGGSGNNGNGNGNGGAGTSTTTTSTTTSTSTTSTTMSDPTTTTTDPEQVAPPMPGSTTTTTTPSTTVTTGPVVTDSTTTTVGTTTTSTPGASTTTLPSTTPTTAERGGTGALPAGDDDPPADVEDGLAAFLSDEASGAGYGESVDSTARPRAVVADRDGSPRTLTVSDWTWFDVEAPGFESAAVAFRMVEAVGRALRTAGEGVAAPASATVTFLAMLFFSRRRMDESAIPFLAVEGSDASKSMHILR